METATEDADAARRLFAQECRFIMGAAALEQLPCAVLPEVAFIGRSNFGKSSLINALAGRKTLARASNTPGRTRQLNFFELGERLMLVDLPGYGYAKAPKTEVVQWQALISGYLRGRAPLRRVCVLIDARHGLKPSDRDMMEMLDTHAVSYQLVMTKADKVSKPQAAGLAAALEAELPNHPAMCPGVIVTSSEKGWGIIELQISLAALTKG